MKGTVLDFTIISRNVNTRITIRSCKANGNRNVPIDEIYSRPPVRPSCCCRGLRRMLVSAVALSANGKPISWRVDLVDRALRRQHFQHLDVASIGRGDLAPEGGG